jgi:chromosome segregation ATPase
MPPRGFLVPRWVVIALAVIGVAGIGVAGAVGYSATQELARQQSDLASAQSDLQAASSELAATQASLSDAKTAHQQATTRLDDLTAKFAAQKACVDARRGDFGKLDEISIALNALWNRTAENSEFATAGEARSKAVNEAIKDYNQAAYRRSLGQISTANGLLAKARAAEKTAADKTSFMDGVLAEVDAGVAKAKADLDALQARLDATGATCAKTG